MSAVWKQRDGTEIKVADMTDDHLINAMAMCMRNRDNSNLSDEKRGAALRWIETLARELGLRGHEDDDDDLIIGRVDRYGSLQ